MPGNFHFPNLIEFTGRPVSKPQTERLGVAALEYFFSERGWLFREQTTHDYGIDAHVEIVVDGRPTGKLIALQIKSGASFFKEQSVGAVIFRTDEKHIAYWIGHSMPVVLVLFNPDSKQAYWQEVSRQTVESTGKLWKLEVPMVSMFDDQDLTFKRLSALTQPEPYVRRLNRLRVDRKWMEKLEDEIEVYVEFDDWVNKSLPRYQVTISGDGEREVWPTLYAPGVGIEAMLEHFFPWADYAVDPNIDSDDSVDDNYGYNGQLMPISDNGETATYRLILTLNDFGKSFLEIDNYLGDSDSPESIGFTLE